MELSMQKKVNRRTTASLRQTIIENEKLHIGQKMNYEQFQDLHNRYGMDYSEKDFARYCLDIEEARLSAMHSESKQSSSYILTQEVVTEEEYEQLKSKVKAYFELDETSKIYYENFEQMYYMFGGRLSPRLFCERILGIRYSYMERARSAQKERDKFAYFEGSQITPKDKCDMIRARILADNDLHIGDQINLQQFNQLYDSYGSELSQREFYERVLEMPIGSLTKLNTETNERATIFSNHVVDPETLYKLRDIVILEADLHIGDTISPQQFEALFRKYGGILSRKIFGEEILDLSESSVRSLSNGAQAVTILQDVEVSDEYIEDVKNRIIRENNYDQNVPINYQKFQELHRKYAYRLSEKMFAILVLEISETSFPKLQNGTQENVIIFKEKQITDITELRKKVIEEARLHYSDKLTYKQIEALHNEYAPNMRESKFALEVLDVETKKLNSMKFSKREFATKILLNEPLPTEEEFEALKWKVIGEAGLHTKDSIDYKKLQLLHRIYGGIIPEAMFAQKILDVGQTGYNNLKGGFQSEVVVLLKTKISDEQLEVLRSEILDDNDIYPGRPITFKHFKRMYYGYVHCMSEIDFAKKILGINYDSYNKLITKERRSVGALVAERKALIREPIVFTDKQVKKLKRYLIQGLSEEQICARFGIDLKTLNNNLKTLIKAKKISEEENIYRRVYNLHCDGHPLWKIAEDMGCEEKDLKKAYDQAKKDLKAKDEESQENYPRAIKARAQKTLDNFEYNSKGIGKVKAYIDQVRSRFEENPESVKKEELDFLDECIVFVQGGADDILLFARICVSMKDYNRAKKFISLNIDNDGITNVDQTRLMKVIHSISYAIKKCTALDMIMKGQEDTNLIATELHMNEVDIIRIKNRVDAGETEPDIDPQEIFYTRRHSIEVR